MPGPKPITIILSNLQQQILSKIIKRHQTPQQLVKRSQLILLMAQGKNNQQAANEIGHDLAILKNFVKAINEIW
jgi:hypothetical protein